MAQIGGFLPVGLGNMVYEQKRAAKTPFLPILDDCEEESLSKAFLRAKEEFIDKVLRGMNTYTDEDLKEKLAEFAKFFSPGENATPEEKAEFAEQFSNFAFKLQKLAASQGNREMLITSSAAGDDEAEGIDGYMQSKMQTNPHLRQQLQGNVS